jgi:tripartite-type tricarboxylate transporter receptor subunit TctC
MTRTSAEYSRSATLDCQRAGWRRQGDALGAAWCRPPHPPDVCRATARSPRQERPTSPAWRLAQGLPAAPGTPAPPRASSRILWARNLLVGSALALVAAPAAAQYPSKPVRVVVPFGAGSSTDTVMRIIAQPLGQALGQPVVVENKPGGDGVVAAIDVKRAAPDGHTLFLATNSPLSAAPHLHRKLPYDPVADFTPISLVGYYTFFVVVPASVPARTIADLIEHARANPGKLNYATGNTTGIVSTATFAKLAKIDIVHVPYKTEPPAITDLLAGQVHLMFSSYSTVAPHVREGKLRALATTLPARSPLLPDVPSIVEAGLPKFPIVPWAGLFGPARMPKEVVDRLQREVSAILTRADVREQLSRQAFEGKGSSSSELAAYVKEQLGTWGKAIREAGIQPE